VRGRGDACATKLKAQSWTANVAPARCGLARLPPWSRLRPLLDGRSRCISVHAPSVSPHSHRLRRRIKCTPPLRPSRPPHRIRSRPWRPSSPACECLACICPPTACTSNASACGGPLSRRLFHRLRCSVSHPLCLLNFTNCHPPRLIQRPSRLPPYLHCFLTPPRRQGLAGRSNKSNNQQGKGGNGTPSPTTSGPYSPSAAPGQTPSFPPMPHSPALSSAMSFESQPTQEGAPAGSRRPPFFFREEYSSLIVRGNFMTLAAKPNLVEEGEWLAHQGTLWFLGSRDPC
jgi:hypothetical protein